MSQEEKMSEPTTKTARKTKPLPSQVEGFPQGIKAKIVLTSSGFLRVVVRDYYHDRKKKRGLEKRKYIGYVVDNKYYSTEDYKKQFKKSGERRAAPDIRTEEPAGIPTEKVIALYSALVERGAQEFPLYYKVAQDIHLVEDLEMTWGHHVTQAILSIAFHWLNTESNAAYLFESWRINKLLPGSLSISSKEMGELFNAISTEPDWYRRFFGARLKRLPEDEVLSYDATQIASDAQEICEVQYAKGKEGTYQYQVGLILLVGHRTGMPVLFRILPGNITDVTTVQDMLFRFEELTEGKRVFAAVVDRGYFSLENIRRFLEKGSRVIIAAKKDPDWIKDAMEEALAKLWDGDFYIAKYDCWGCTVPVDLDCGGGKKRTVWVHVYRTDEKSKVENKKFFKKLVKFEEDWLEVSTKEFNKDCPLLKSPTLKYYRQDRLRPGVLPERDGDAVNQGIRYTGLFCNVTTMECTAAEAMTEYRARDGIEKTFKAGKTNLEMDVIRAHTNSVMEGRFIVSFVALSILNELKRRMKKVSGKTAVAKELKGMTFEKLKNKLQTPRFVMDGKGSGYWMSVTEDQRKIAKLLGCPGAYTEIPKWALS